MSYSFRPWTSPKAISPGEDIRNYIAATAQDSGIDRHIRFQHRITSAAWSSQNAAWEVNAIENLPNGAESPVTLTCNFILSCAGYYRYSSGHLQISQTSSNSQAAMIRHKPGRIFGLCRKAHCHHRQRSNKRRSPWYLHSHKQPRRWSCCSARPHTSLPYQSKTLSANGCKVLPSNCAYRLCLLEEHCLRFRASISAQQMFPHASKAGILKKTHARRRAGLRYATTSIRGTTLGSSVSALCPMGDMFKAIRSGRASVVTAQIKTFTLNGVQLE